MSNFSKRSTVTTSLAVVISIAAGLVISGSAVAQVALPPQGTAVGWVAASAGTEAGDILPDQTASNVNLGFGSFDVQNMLTDPSEAIFVQADFPHIRVRVDSNSLDGGVGYGAAYFEDTLMVVGGTGAAEIRIAWDIDGGVNGDGGGYGINALPPGGQPMGSAAVNFRTFIGGFGEPTLDLADTNLFPSLATDPMGMMGVPFFDPQDQSGGPGGNSGPGTGNFLFDQLDEFGNPTGELFGGIYTDQNAGLLAATGGGARFNWTYGESFDLAFLLEAWASDGGIADFASTGTLISITIPQGSTLVTETGGPYNVIYAPVPEPSAAVALTLVGIPCFLRRRRSSHQSQ